MEAISGYFEDLDFARCALGDHALDGDRLTVSVLSGLVLKEHHPLARSGTPPPKKCRLVFSGVTYSKRILRSKRRDGSFKEDVSFLGPFSQGHGPTRAFDFGGSVRAKVGRVDWEIEAREFSLEP